MITPFSSLSERKIVQALLLVVVMLLPLFGIAQSGNGSYDAIYAGSFSGCSGNSFNDSRNNSYYNGTYYNDNFNYDINNSYVESQESPDVWYRFSVNSNNTDINLSLCGSNFDTYIHLLDDLGNPIISNDDSDECGYQSMISYEGLSAGTYYVVVEGYGSATGDFNLSITAPANSSITPGGNMNTAINAGVFSNSEGYTDIRSNNNACLGDDMGQESNDIYYKFTLNSAATVALSHCGSGFDTYLWLLNSAGTVINSNDDDFDNFPCLGNEAYLHVSLPAGTYYLVSEGYGSNSGNIVSSIAVTIVPVTVTYPSFPASFTAGIAISPISPTVTGSPSFDRQITTSLAGAGYSGFADGTGSSAGFDWPLHTAVDGAGTIYVADSRNQRIRKVTQTGVVTTLAGNSSGGFTNGTGSAASFRNPAAVAVDASGNVYVADQQNHSIRKIAPAGVVTTLAGNGTAGFADGTGANARFNSCAGITLGPDGNLYVGDGANHRIRKVTMAGVVTTYAGTGTLGTTNGAAASATFNQPRNLSFDAAGNLYVGDRINHMIRKITPAGVVSTLAGNGTSGFSNGTGTAARFNAPNSVAVDAAGNVYVADQVNNQIRKITPAGDVSTFAGDLTPGNIDGAGSTVRFNNPFGLCIDKNGTLYVADYHNHKIRKLQTAPFSISPDLPAGMQFNTSTGAISGTPSGSVASAAYTIKAYNTATATITFAVQPGAPPISPSQDQNYIISYSPNTEFSSEASMLAATADKSQVQTTIQYFDRLGRPMQTVQAQASPEGKDIIQPIEYDAYGRESKKYLPYASGSNTAKYRADGLTAVGSFYANPVAAGAPGVVQTSFPYAETLFEASPLNRVLQQGAPGDAWQLPGTPNAIDAGHTVRMDYGSNGQSEVRLFQVTATGACAAGTEYYQPNQLYKTITKDENWTGSPEPQAGTTEEFKDKEGRVVLKRTYNLHWDEVIQQSNLEVLSTYYVYDDFGNLRFVLPPAVDTESGGTISQTVLDKFCYQYKYDERNRLVEKRIPGKDWEYLVYNKLDQVVATQDGVQRTTHKWIFTKYDALGRPVITGLTTVPLIRDSCQAIVNRQSVLWESKDNASSTGYTNTTAPAQVDAYYTINYYDDYTFGNLSTLYPDQTTFTNRTRGLLTASRVWLTDNSASYYTVNYYDKEGRLKVAVAQNSVGGIDSIVNTYNFTNQLTRSIRTHSSNNIVGNLVLADSIRYDHVGRKLESRQSINNAPEIIISRLSYNAVGQVKDKEIHSTNGTSFINKTSYTYNPRGWLKSQTNPFFNMHLRYNENNSGQYNGNIAKQTWGPAANPSLHNYTYSYDKLNRLANGTSDEGFNETLSYDLMGNIQKLVRDVNSPKTINYFYDGNRLDSLAGHLNGGFSYDLNGSVIKDRTKGTEMTISYNHLNLPQTITKGSEQMVNIWLSTGEKIKKVVGGLKRDYIRGIEYNNDAIELIHTEEGRVRPNGASYFYEYLIKDHLGNTRVMIDQSGAVLETSDYYPFGLQVARTGQTVPSPENRYKFNGKELQTEMGLNQYDYGARFYDPVIARWNAIDPLAELGRRWSPYIQSFDNPVNFVDPDGMWASALTKTDAMVGMDEQSAALDKKEEEKKKAEEKKKQEEKEKQEEEGATIANTPGTIIKKKPDGSLASSKVPTGDGHVLSDILELVFGFTQVGPIFDVATAIEGTDRSGNVVSPFWRLVGLFPMVSEARKANQLISVVKKDKALLKFAEETFKGNTKLRAETNAILNQMLNGNMNPGIGSQHLFGSVFEARGRGGARVYFQNNNSVTTIVGYSHKGNQKQVINRLRQLYEN